MSQRAVAAVVRVIALFTLVGVCVFDFMFQVLSLSRGIGIVAPKSRESDTL